jgi:hypothetical protein
MIDRETDFLSDEFALENVGRQKRDRRKPKQEKIHGQSWSRRSHRDILIEYRSDSSNEGDLSPLHELSYKSPPYEKELIARFILHNGPEAVNSAAFQNMNEFTIGENHEDMFGKAIGTTFERLAHLTVTDALVQRPDVFSGFFPLDPGSASRVFSKIFKLHSGFIPDSAIVSSDSPTTVKSIIEYKMNPEAHPFQLNSQLEKMLDFIEKYKGKTIKLNWERGFNIDIVKGIRSDSISFDPSIGVFLVSPKDRNWIDLPEGNISQIHTPFDSAFVVSVATASLNYIKSKLL